MSTDNVIPIRSTGNGGPPPGAEQPQRKRRPRLPRAILERRVDELQMEAFRCAGIVALARSVAQQIEELEGLDCPEACDVRLGLQVAEKALRELAERLDAHELLGAAPPRGESSTSS